MHREHRLAVALHVCAKLVERDHLRVRAITTHRPKRQRFKKACSYCGMSGCCVSPSPNSQHPTHVERLLNVGGDALNHEHQEGDHHSQHRAAPLRQRPQQQRQAVDVAQQETGRVPARVLCVSGKKRMEGNSSVCRCLATCREVCLKAAAAQASASRHAHHTHTSCTLTGWLCCRCGCTPQTRRCRC